MVAADRYQTATRPFAPANPCKISLFSPRQNPVFGKSLPNRYPPRPQALAQRAFSAPLRGCDTLVKGQEGYAYNPVEQKVIKDWDEHLVVIASDAGDPYCLDLRRNDTAVFWAEHGAGTWDFQPAFDCLEDFLESVLDVPKTQEYETAYPYHYIRLIVTGISDTKKALVFLKQHFGDSSFQQTKDRLKELPLLIYSGLDTGTAPLENSLDRWGLMYEKQQISLEKFLEDQAYIRNL